MVLNAIRNQLKRYKAVATRNTKLDQRRGTESQRFSQVSSVKRTPEVAGTNY
jgi:hypothetical protein